MLKKLGDWVEDRRLRIEDRDSRSSTLPSLASEIFLSSLQPIFFGVMEHWSDG
jgi:hypothetical protein